MDHWINYHHLHYFWVIAREGSVTAAARKLNVSPSTVSIQLKALETDLGVALFHRQGRRLVLAEAGRTAMAYADDIFSTGAELRTALTEQRDDSRVLSRLRVGIADILPRLLAWRFLQPVLAASDRLHIVCRSDSPERLVAELALHELDIVITDTPVGLARGVRAYTHPLRSGTVDVYATPALAARLQPGWPDSLSGTPFLLPAESTPLRRNLDDWFASRSIRPLVVGEFEDSALLKAFGEAGVGCFAMSTALAADLQARYGVVSIGTLDELEERYYAVTRGRRPTSQAVRRILSAAKAPLDA